MKATIPINLASGVCATIRSRDCKNGIVNVLGIGGADTTHAPQ